jgi:hypothetical protein
VRKYGKKPGDIFYLLCKFVTDPVAGISFIYSFISATEKQQVYQGTRDFKNSFQ